MRLMSIEVHVADFLVLISFPFAFGELHIHMRKIRSLGRLVFYMLVFSATRIFLQIVFLTGKIRHLSAV